jgi:DNA topoisomerase-1
VLGADPATGEQVTLRNGRFGPYFQLGEGEKPKRAGVPKGWVIEDIDLVAALKLLSLPREIGIHPETGKPITAGIGRYGPFVENAGKYANLDSLEEVFSVGANRAISLLAEKKSRRPRASASALKELGEHPTSGGAVTVRSGRYGPYVNHGKLNATLPRDVKPEDVTLEQAVELLAEKESRGPSKKRAAKPRKSPAKKSAGRARAKAAAAE